MDLYLDDWRKLTSIKIEIISYNTSLASRRIITFPILPIIDSKTRVDCMRMTNSSVLLKSRGIPICLVSSTIAAKPPNLTDKTLRLWLKGETLNGNVNELNLHRLSLVQFFCFTFFTNCSSAILEHWILSIPDSWRRCRYALTILTWISMFIRAGISTMRSLPGSTRWNAAIRCLCRHSWSVALVGWSKHHTSNLSDLLNLETISL